MESEEDVSDFEVLVDRKQVRCNVCHDWKQQLKPLNQMSKKDRKLNKHCCSGIMCIDFDTCPTKYVKGHPKAAELEKQRKQKERDLVKKQKEEQKRKELEEKEARRQEKNEKKLLQEEIKKRKLGNAYHDIDANLFCHAELRANASETWTAFKKARNISDSNAGPSALHNVVLGLRECFKDELESIPLKEEGTTKKFVQALEKKEVAGFPNVEGKENSLFDY